MSETTHRRNTETKRYAQVKAYMSETTHRLDPDTRRYVQVVSPARLREILDDAGEDYTPPSGFGDEDEWDVGA